MSETNPLHDCSGDLPQEGDGPAVSCCAESEDGTLWIFGGGNSSQVGYCPYCGFQAKVIPTLVLLRRLGAGD